MPSNKELQTQAEALAEELEIVGIDTGGLNNEQLAELVSDLKAKKKDADTVTQADTPPKVEPAPKPKARYTLAEGKALCTLRGILGEGEPITAKDVKGGQSVIDKFVRTGYIDDNR